MSETDQTQKLDTSTIRKMSDRLTSQNGSVSITLEDAFEPEGSGSRQAVYLAGSNGSSKDQRVSSAPARNVRPGNKLQLAGESQKLQKSVKSPLRTISRIEQSKLRGIQERCRHLCLNLFFDERSPIRSLGFTSAMSGEGKTFLAVTSAIELAKDSIHPVTLIECNWEHPSLHEYFDIPATPGMAEWLRGECGEEEIRHQVGANLNVIPAGNGMHHAVQLLQLMRVQGVIDMSAHPNELLIVDLPATVTTAYGPLAAGLVESLMIVVRARSTPDKLIAETRAQLKDLPVHGVILNQIESSIPRWLQQML